MHATQKRLRAYVLAHEPAVDESQAVIFDALNGMRTELEPLDHVRNSLFVRIPPTEALDLYEHSWKACELALRKVKQRRMKSGPMFLYDYVISCGEKKRQGSVTSVRGAAHFAAMTKDLPGSQLSTYVRDQFLPAMATWPFVVGRSDEVTYHGVTKEFPRRVIQLRDSIRDLSENPPNPLVLHFARGFVAGRCTPKDLEEALFRTEGFLARHLLASRPLSPLRSKFMDVMATLDGSLCVATLARALSAAEGSTTDIASHALSAVCYTAHKPRSIAAILRGIERHLCGAGAMNFVLNRDPERYEIEHIYPQKPGKWEADLTKWGADQAKMAGLLHTLGNLTVVTKDHNNKVGNKRLVDKQDYPLVAGRVAPLKLNESWLRKRKWTEREIVERTKHLVKSALDYWKP